MQGGNKVFELNWSWYEEYIPILFYHESKTHQEFIEDVNRLLVALGDEYIDSETSWIGAKEWIDFVANRLPELGYEKIEPMSHGFFGSYIIKEDEESNDFQLAVGKRLWDKACAANKLIEDRMYIKIEDEI